ncbi:2-nitropropane dioxygenase [Microbacterium lushaniae]|uniref:Propionate 3-nitronate monooxygenase n=2 Tax=Microbacterium lushaniae TaxID=2614639 RepID=A0A5J6L8I0_9MICO|nr:nitronate monooxygenase [Microbacterium lushaniae]QEW04874.1 2-nitropropane dioxygenase [Microbacterium lushaniae]
MLGIEHPIVLGPFGGLSSVELVAVVSEAGGLGSYGLYGYSADRIADTARAIRAATDRPFALNVWLPLETDPGAPAAGFDRAARAVAPLYAAVGAAVPTAVPDALLPPVQEQWDAVVEAAPAAVSCVYGVPTADMVSRAHARGIAVVGTATTVAEAVALEGGGVDAVVATGFEAAGHRVSFLRGAEQSLVGSMALVPQVVDAVAVPVIAAGGIADRRGVAAASALGAAGVQVGTAFLSTRQSAASESHRRSIRSASADGTVLTRAMSGRLARGIPNHAVEEIEAAGAIAPFPLQNWLTGGFRAAAAQQDRGDLLSLWAGQAAPLAREDDARRVFDELLAGVPARS